MTPHRQRNRRVATATRAGGFSLIEMLISLAIIIILFTMMFGFTSRKNQLTKKQKCLANLQKLHISLQIYANEHDDWFPRHTNAVTSEDALAVLVPQYAADTTIFVCPGSKDKALAPGAVLANERISYAYYMGRRQSDAKLPLMSDRQVDTKPKVAGTQVFSDDGKKPANNHFKYGGVILFTDGSTEMSGVDAPVALPIGTNIVLLNPKP